MSGRAPRTLVVVPAYHEEDAIAATLKDLANEQPDLDVVVIDDGSTDATATIAAQSGANVVRLPFNLGVGGAVRTGLRYAVEHGYDRTVIFDGDGQHLASSITSLLEVLDDGADMAVGSRFALDAPGYEVGGSRRRAMALLSRIVGWSTGRVFTDTTSGFRAFGREPTELLARAYPVEYLADTVEVLILLCREGYRVEEVPVAMRPRTSGQPSSRSFKLVFNYLRLLIGILASASRPRPTRERSS
jgi:glycosyltransferase involved in cell wall biosynthesis